MSKRIDVTAPEPHASALRATKEKLPRHIWVLAGVLTLGAVMTMLDSTAVNVAFGTIRRDFNASLATAQWVLTGYLLTMAVTVPLTGWAADRFGTKRLWIFSVAVFVVGSALSGLSWSIASLIVFRVLQGAGGGMIIPVAQTIMAAAAGPGRLGRAMSLLGFITVLGPVLGPVLGGILVQYVNWHWIFYINVPIGLVALVTAAKLLPSRAGGKHQPFDFLGMALISLGLALLLFGLSQTSNSATGSASSISYVSMALGGVSLAAFFCHSLRRGPAGLIDVRLFAYRYFSVASAFLFVVSTVLFGALFLIPLYYQMIRGAGAFTAGMLMVPQTIGLAIAMPFAGKLTDRFGARPVVLPGLLLTLLGTLAFTQVTTRSPFLSLTAALVIRGMGIGCIMSPTTAASYASLPAEALARAASVTTLLRQLGASVGTTVFAILLADEIAHTKAVAAFRDTFWIIVAMTAILPILALFMPQKSSDDASRIT